MGPGFLVRRGFRDAEALRQLTRRHLGGHLRAALSWEGSVEAGALFAAPSPQTGLRPQPSLWPPRRPFRGGRKHSGSVA